MVDHAHKSRDHASEHLAREFTSLVERLTREHARLLSLAERRKRAFARADIRDIRATVLEESEAVQTIASMERERESLAQRAAARLGVESPEGGAPTLRAIASCFEEPDRSRLLAMAESLRALIVRVRQENESVREAAEHLATHMRGLLQTVEHKLSTSGAYGPSGSVGVGPAVLTAMDVTT